MDFKRVKINPNYGTHSFFGGSSCNGVRLGVSAPYITSAEGKKRVRAKFGSVGRVPSGDGKVTWECYFTHPDTPGVYFTIYDWKGAMSCGFGISNSIYQAMEKSYAEKLNRMLAELVNYALGA